MLSGGLGIINGIVDKAFASSLPSGSISALRYAQTLKEMISSLIIGSLMTTIFTEISEVRKEKDLSLLKKRLTKTSNDIINVMIPITFWLILMGEVIVSTVFERGRFSAESTNMVTISLIGYSITLIATPLSSLLLKVFTAFKKTKIPFLITIISIFSNFIFNAILIRNFEVFGIALSTSAVSVLNLIVLSYAQKKMFKINFFEMKKFLITFSVCFLSFICLFFIKNQINYVLWLIIVNFLYAIFFIYFKYTKKLT
jgi:putative peptidoglycan lipid II flippase